MPNLVRDIWQLRPSVDYKFLTQLDLDGGPFQDITMCLSGL